jgi:hypothetical protein
MIRDEKEVLMRQAISPGTMIRASVLVQGMKLPVYLREDGYPFVAGTPGRAYTLAVENLTSARIEVVVSVDQRDVLTDKVASQGSGGMLLGAGVTQEWKGWRVSDTAVREFLFADPSVSVAAQATGDPSSTGVIGFMAWQEAVVMRPQSPMSTMDSYEYKAGGARPRGGLTTNSSSPSAAGASANSDLGTGIGDYLEDKVRYVSFTRAGSPDILTLGYASKEELIRRGIIRDPDPFPGGYERYVRP